MTVTDLLQVVPTILTQVVRMELLEACCHELVNNLLHVNEIILVGTTCCAFFASSTLFEDGNNWFQTCEQLGTNSANTSC
jgi:hypothetical protein